MVGAAADDGPGADEAGGEGEDGDGKGNVVSALVKAWGGCWKSEMVGWLEVQATMQAPAMEPACKRRLIPYVA